VRRTLPNGSGRGFDRKALFRKGSDHQADSPD
jgi:hypothetical protein